MSSWWIMLQEKMKERGDTFPPMFCTLLEAEMKVDFDEGYGSAEGKPFTAWGENWVYFPCKYDGLEWVGSAPRNPCHISMKHQ